MVLMGSTSVFGATPRKDKIVILISLDGFPAYALDDPRLPIPTLRRLSREGVSATSMHPINPTVTWANHTAIVTGVDASEHNVLFNGLLVRGHDGQMPKVDAAADKTALVHAPTIYDVAFEAGLTTAQVDWVAINRANTITWQFPELPDPSGEIERELIADHVVTAEELRTYENSTQAWQDQIWTDAAVRILEEHKPNLLMFHLLGVDDANHEYGPMSNASQTAMAMLDARVKRILDVIEKQGLSSRATLIIVSDHGFRKVEHTIRPNALLRVAGILKQTSGVWKGGAWVMSEGGTADVYVTDPTRRTELTDKIRKLLQGKEGIQGVYGPADFARLGYPLPEKSNQGPDMVITGVPGYMFANEPEGDYSGPPTEGGTHGFINDDPQMQAIFLAWGADVPHGVRLGAISNLDVAPTIAKLLGLEMKHVKGHPISQIVEPTPPPAGSTR